MIYKTAYLATDINYKNSKNTSITKGLFCVLAYNKSTLEMFQLVVVEVSTHHHYI